MWEISVANVAPPSDDRTVAPSWPTATALEAVEKATASRFCPEGETSDPVRPPSVVRTSTLVLPPLAGAVAIRQCVTSLQEICVSVSRGVPAGSVSASAVQLAPPSVLCKSVLFAPTAYALVADTNEISDSGAGEEATCVQEFAPSVVRKIRPPLPPVTANPTVAEVNSSVDGSRPVERHRRLRLDRLPAVGGQQNAAVGLLDEARARAEK